jgi:hypothetical protein
MKNKLIIPIILTLGIFLIGIVCSASVNYCCEKTKDGAWCQNAPQGDCNTNYRSNPASCEATSYCKLGCCYNSQEGTCMENTPQKVCEDTEGIWEDNAECDIPQCTLGCCLIGDQAAYVTQTRCKRLSLLYGLEINYRTDISSEFQCISMASSEEEGACVFERDFEITCLRTTKKECQEMQVSNTSDVEFHKGYLCSSESLGTNCGPTEKTTCVEGKDEVYFLDSCGNIANVYDASKIKDKNYWGEIKTKDESCNPNSDNAESATCGNCDYYLGSTCKEYKRGENKVKPNYGDNICRDLSCTYEGKKYQHGETWCANARGTENNLPGSRYFRLVCYNGEVSVEPCADFRQEVCLESDIDGFRTAACRANMWQDCAAQNNAKDCNNEDVRDCKWNGEKCVPDYAPGFNFWEEGDADSICALANAQCVVKYEKKLGSEKTCIENCECLSNAWQDKMNSICISLGDCGSKANYLGFAGG